ncbi:hypothetical protein C0Q70_19250 [Pomacea canaliculata]|uniref:Armadillo repeat-containing domain-containing protein n=1 Tax=Pomacea canaliculata TaxID=400727 RepID=A0A2T7NIU4_POMCA|nr:hypothetical protein C0Q70_19250 [Pomacea canaliculata]
MAAGIGVQTLIEFVSSMSASLHLIGSEGLGALAQVRSGPGGGGSRRVAFSLHLDTNTVSSLHPCSKGPKSQQSQIATANGIQPMVRLLKAESEALVLSVIRCLRYLSVGVGNVPHHKNQSTVSGSRGVKLLVALMVHSYSEEVQVESAYTLGCIALGNSDTMEEIHNHPDFSYVRILKMMYAADSRVRVLAGSALAAFAYNSIQQQREIADHGGVRFHCFVPFLRSDNEEYRCNAAYQVVVLARIIPDEEQAVSSAVGIKLLVDILQESRNDNILATAADYIACLAHTRAGVPSAIVSVNAIEFLCDMLLNQSEQVRGNSAIALSYLSFNHAGERQLLNRCRNDPYLMQVMKFYTKRSKLSPSFCGRMETFQPPRSVRSDGRPSLVRARPPKEDLLPVAMLGMEDAHWPPSRLSEEGQATGRTSQASRTSHLSRGSRRSRASRQSRGSFQSGLTLQATQLSLDTRGTQSSLQDMVLVDEA